MRIVLLLFASTLAAQPRLVQYREVVRPILTNCAACHRQTRSAGLILRTYGGLIDGAFKDGQFHPVIERGNADASVLIQYLDGRKPAPHRALPEQNVREIRRWIDDGARPDDTTAREFEVEVDGVPLSAEDPSFWLSCRAPRNGQNIGLRVKIIDDATGRVVAYDWPTSSRDLNGRWSQWKIMVPKNLMNLPGSVSVRLYVSGDRDENELDGVIFLIEPKQTPASELLKQKDLRTIPLPDPPPHEDLRLRYVLRAPSDVTLIVRPEGSKTELFRRTDRDLPAQRVLETGWDLRSTPQVKTGWYSARLMCSSRTPGLFQPDMAILFRIVR